MASRAARSATASENRSRIAIVEDDEDFRETLIAVLSRAGYEPVAFGCSSEFSTNASHYDLAIVDVGLPDGSGYAIVRSLSEVATPIIILTGRDSVADRVEGYTHGASIFMVKPTTEAELLAAIGSSLRSKRWAVRNDLSRWRLDRAAATLISPSGKRTRLSVRECDFVDRLMQNPGTAIGRKELAELIGIERHKNGGRALDMFVARLRQNISSQTSGETPIETVPRIGFAFRQS